MENYMNARVSLYWLCIAKHDRNINSRILEASNIVQVYDQEISMHEVKGKPAQNYSEETWNFYYDKLVQSEHKLRDAKN